MLNLKKLYQKNVSQSLRFDIGVLRLKLKSLTIIGSKVTCNCCGSRYAKFLSYGDYIKRENALCPNCMSLERTRALYNFLLSHSDYLKNASVLHFAPEKIIEKTLKSNPSIHSYISADIDPFLAMEQVDITNIKFKDASFNLVLCSHVLSVVKEDKKALKEILRILKPGGTLILQEKIYDKYEVTYEDDTVNTDDERFEKYGAHYLVRLYGKDFVQKLKYSGFDVNVYNPELSLGLDYVRKHGIQDSGMIYLCKKPV